MKQLWLITILILACAQLNAQSARLKIFGEMSWIGGEQNYSNTFQVNAGDWVEYRIQCDTGQYIQSCGQPEYYNATTGQHIKFNCLKPWTIGPTTEQVCGLASPMEGSVTVTIPVLYYGVRYSGTYEVTAGPGN